MRLVDQGHLNRYPINTVTFGPLTTNYQIFIQWFTTMQFMQSNMASKISWKITT